MYAFSLASPSWEELFLPRFELVIHIEIKATKVPSHLTKKVKIRWRKVREIKRLQRNLPFEVQKGSFDNVMG